VQTNFLSGSVQTIGCTGLFRMPTSLGNAELGDLAVIRVLQISDIPSDIVLALAWFEPNVVSLVTVHFVRTGECFHLSLSAIDIQRSQLFSRVKMAKASSLNVA
jgi:hypothetical protein